MFISCLGKCAPRDSSFKMEWQRNLVFFYLCFLCQWIRYLEKLSGYLFLLHGEEAIQCTLWCEYPTFSKGEKFWCDLWHTALARELRLYSLKVNFPWALQNSPKKALTDSSTKKLISAFVLFWLNYFKYLFAELPKRLFDKLQRAQNHTISVVN